MRRTSTASSAPRRVAVGSPDVVDTPTTAASPCGDLPESAGNLRVEKTRRPRARLRDRPHGRAANHELGLGRGVEHHEVGRFARCREGDSHRIRGHGSGGRVPPGHRSDRAEDRHDRAPIGSGHGHDGELRALVDREPGIRHTAFPESGDEGNEEPTAAELVDDLRRGPAAGAESGKSLDQTGWRRTVIARERVVIECPTLPRHTRGVGTQSLATSSASASVNAPA